MDKKKIEKLLKQNNKKSGKNQVSFADDSVTTFFKPLVNELYRVFRKNPGINTDLTTLSSEFEININLKFAQAKHMLLVLKEAFGVEATEAELEMPFKDFLPWLSQNRTVHNPQYLCPPLLGIIGLTDQNDDDWHIGYFFGVKDQLDYYTGYFLGKTSKEMLQLKQKRQEEIDNYQKLVYGIDPKIHFVIRTIEGDKILCNNRYEVCCWIIARASNYRPELNQKENW